MTRRLFCIFDSARPRRTATHLLAALACAALLAASGCGGDDSSEGAGEGAGDGFVGQNYLMKVVAVDDACNKGALNALFLPEGAGSESPFDDPIYVPGKTELPWEGEIKLPDPFKKADVKIEGSDETRTIVGADNTAVLLDEATHPGCLVDFETSVTMNIADPARITGSAVLSMSNLAGEVGNCPDVETDPCNITIDLVGSPSAN